MNINQSHTNSTCSKCGASYERTPGQIKKWDRVCKPCTNARSRQWTINRLLAGKPTKFWKASPEQQKRYAAASAAKPDFKMKKAERDRLYALDPSNYPKLKARWLAATAISNGRLARTFPPFAVIPVITIGFGLPIWTVVVLVAAMMYDGIINTWLTRFDCSWNKPKP